MNLKEKITNLREDKRGVSPVIGVIMMIAIVVIIAAVVAAFAYGIIGGVNKAPSAAMVVEGVHAGSGVNVSLFHHGGDTITEAFNATKDHAANDLEDIWHNIELRKNGAKVTNTTAGGVWLNDVAYTKALTSWDDNFDSGDMLKIKFTTLAPDDSIVILHTPSDSILQRVTVM
jgi:flagellin-like protein